MARRDKEPAPELAHGRYRDRRARNLTSRSSTSVHHQRGSLIVDQATGYAVFSYSVRSRKIARSTHARTKSNTFYLVGNGPPSVGGFTSAFVVCVDGILDQPPPRSQPSPLYLLYFTAPNHAGSAQTKTHIGRKKKGTRPTRSAFPPVSSLGGVGRSVPLGPTHKRRIPTRFMVPTISRV